MLQRVRARGTAQCASDRFVSNSAPLLARMCRPPPKKLLHGHSCSSCRAAAPPPRAHVQTPAQEAQTSPRPATAPRSLLAQSRPWRCPGCAGDPRRPLMSRVSVTSLFLRCARRRPKSRTSAHGQAEGRRALRMRQGAGARFMCRTSIMFRSKAWSGFLIQRTSSRHGGREHMARELGERTSRADACGGLEIRPAGSLPSRNAVTSRAGPA